MNHKNTKKINTSQIWLRTKDFDKLEDCTCDKVVKLEDVFHFEYSGGGYFRKKGVPEGEKAEIIHGMEAIKYIINEVNK